MSSEKLSLTDGGMLLARLRAEAATSVTSGERFQDRLRSWKNDPILPRAYDSRRSSLWSAPWAATIWFSSESSRALPVLADSSGVGFLTRDKPPKISTRSWLKKDLTLRKSWIWTHEMESFLKQSSRLGVVSGSGSAQATARIQSMNTPRGIMFVSTMGNAEYEGPYAAFSFKAASSTDHALQGGGGPSPRLAHTGL